MAGEPLERARITLEADTQQFQRDWKATLATVAKGTAAVAGLAAGVSVLNRGLKEPTKTIKTLGTGVAALASNFKSLQSAVAATAKSLSEGEGARTALARGYAALKAQLAQSRIELGKFLGEYQKLPKVFSFAGEAVKKSRFELGFFAEILGGLVFAGISKVSGALADRLNPQLEGLASNAGRVTDAQRQLEKATIGLATAFEKGRQSALAPFHEMLAAIVPELGATGKLFVEQVGVVATWTRVGLSAVSYVTSLGAKLLAVVGVVKLFNAALQTSVVQSLAASLSITITSTTTLTTALKGLISLSFSTLITSVKTFGESIGIAVQAMRGLLTSNPLVFVAITGMTAVLTAASVAWFTYAKRVRDAETAAERQRRALLDSRALLDDYVQTIEKFTAAEQEALLAVKQVVDAVESRSAALRAAQAEAGGQGAEVAAINAQESERQQREEVLKIDKEIKKIRQEIESDLAEVLTQALEKTKKIVKATGEWERGVQSVRDIARTLQGILDQERQLYQSMAAARDALRASAQQHLDTEEQLLAALRRQSSDYDALARKEKELREVRAREQVAAAEEERNAAAFELRQLEAKLNSARETLAERARGGWLDSRGKPTTPDEERELAALEGAVEAAKAHATYTETRLMTLQRTTPELLKQAAAETDVATAVAKATVRYNDQKVVLERREAALRGANAQLTQELTDLDRRERREGQSLQIAEERARLMTRGAELQREGIRLQADALAAGIAFKQVQYDTMTATGQLGDGYQELGASLEADKARLKGILATTVGIADTILLERDRVELLNAEDARRLQNRQALLAVEQQNYGAQISGLEALRDAVGVQDESLERDETILEIEMQILRVRKQSLEAQKEAINESLRAARIEEERYRKLHEQTGSAGTEADLDKATAQVKLLEANLKGVDAQNQALEASALALTRQYERLGTTIIRWGDLMADAAVQGIEAWRTGAGDFKDILRQFQDSLVGSFTNGIGQMLSEKLKFDQIFKHNFLEELPGVARQGAGLIGQAFSGLGNVFGGGGAGGGNWLNSLGSVFQNFSAGGTGATGGGSGSWLGSLFNSGASAAQGVNGVAGIFGGGLGGGGATGSIVDLAGVAGSGIAGPVAPATQALLSSGLDLAGTALAPNIAGPVAPATQAALTGTSTAAGGLGAAAASTGIMAAVAAAVIGIIGTITTALATSKARDTFYSRDDGRKFAEKAIYSDPILGGLAELTTRIMSFGAIGGREGGRGMFDLLSGDVTAKNFARSTALFMANPLAPIIYLAAQPPTGGTALRKGFEEFVEHDGAAIGFFGRNSGTFKRGIGQTGLSANDVHGGDLVDWQRDLIGQGWRGLHATMGGDASVDALDAQEAFNNRLREGLGLLREQNVMVNAMAVGYRAVVGGKAGDSPARVKGLIGDFLGSAVYEGADPTEVADIAAQATLAMSRPKILFSKVIEAKREGLVTDDEYRDFVQGAAKSAFADAPTGVDPMLVALDLLREKGEVVFSDLERRITALSQEAEVTGDAFRDVIQGAVAGTDKAVLKQGFFATLRENITGTVMASFEQAFLETSLKPALMAPFFQTLREQFERLAESGNDPTVMTGVVDTIKEAGKAAIASLEGMTPLLDQAIDAARELAAEFDALGTRKPTVGELTLAFAQSLKDGFKTALEDGINDALGAGTAALGMKGIATTLGGFIQQAVAGALVQGLMQSSVIQTALTPLQTVLATAMAQAVAGGVTAGTMAGVQSAVSLTAEAFKTMLTNLKPLFATVFESLGDVGAMFGGPTVAQRAEQTRLQDRLTALSREQTLIQRAASLRITALQRELEIMAQYHAMQQAAQRAIEQIQGSQLGGLTIYEQLELTRTRLDEALGKFRKPGATVEERTAAADRILELLPELMQRGAVAYQAESPEFAALRAMTLAIAEEIRTVGAENSKGFEAKQKELVELQKKSERQLDAIRIQAEKTTQLLEDLNRTIERQAGQITPGAGGGRPDAISTEGSQQLRSVVSGLTTSGATYRRLGHLRALTDITSGQQASSAAILHGREAGLSGEALQNEVQRTLELFQLIQNLFPNLGTDAHLFREIVQDLMAEIRDPSRTSPRLGFGRGGMVPGRPGAPVTALVHGGELVLPPSVAAMVTRLPAAASVGLPTPFGALLGEIQRVAQLSGAREPAYAPATPALALHPGPALTTRYVPAGADPAAPARARRGGDAITIAAGAIQNTIHLPPGSNLDEDALARKLAAQIDAQITQSVRHGKLRQVMKGTR